LGAGLGIAVYLHLKSVTNIYVQLIDLSDLYMWCEDTINFVYVNRYFAMVNARDGKLVISHVDKQVDTYISDLPVRSFIPFIHLSITPTSCTVSVIYHLVR
jgi:hypothetical protein